MRARNTKVMKRQKWGGETGHKEERWEPWERGRTRGRSRIRRAPLCQSPTNNPPVAPLTPDGGESAESSWGRDGSVLLRVPRTARDLAAGSDPQAWNLSPRQLLERAPAPPSPGRRESAGAARTRCWLWNARLLGTAPGTPGPGAPATPAQLLLQRPLRAACGEKGTCERKEIPGRLGLPFHLATHSPPSRGHVTWLLRVFPLWIVNREGWPKMCPPRPFQL